MKKPTRLVPSSPFPGVLQYALAAAVVACLGVSTVRAQTLRTLEKDLQKEDPARLAKDARSLGEATRGAILFYQQHTTCTKCHAFGEDSNPLGPDLTKPREDGKQITDVFLVESILQPSKEIRQGYETVVVITDDGLSVTGLLESEDDEKLVLRDPAEDEDKRIVIPKDQIDERAESDLSVMPPELMNQLANRQQFLDLVRYVMEITSGGPKRAWELEPEPSLYAPPPLPEYEDHIDHAGMIADFDQESFKRGEEIYSMLCVNCHGTKDEPGSLPTSLRFADGTFRNGSDPHSMYKTLTSGFGLMVSQTWMVPQQKYDAVHYIRQTYLKPHNPSQYVEIDESYLASLPRGDTKGPAPVKYEPWVAMDYGPHLTASYEVGSDASNFAYKGVAVRLDAGPGGVSRGHYWMIFDEDTLRVAAGWSGDGFIDYRAIMLNGQHNSHPRVVGQLHFENKTAPGWGKPESGTFDDPRFLGRDDRPYGPLPRDWAHFKGLYHHGNRVVLSYTVGRTSVLETPGVIAAESAPVFTRTFNVGPRADDMILQVAQQSGTESALHSLAEVLPEGFDIAWKDGDPASSSLAIFGPGGAMLIEEPTVEVAPEPAEESETVALKFNGATRVEITPADDFDMTTADYTITARIKTKSDGTIFCKTAPTDTWIPNGKTFFVRGGRLTFDIGWVGALAGKTMVNDNLWHDVALSYQHEEGRVRLFVDGQLDAQGNLKPKAAVQDHVLRIGFTAGNFPASPFFEGQIADVRFYAQAMVDAAAPTENLLAQWATDTVDAENRVVDSAAGKYHALAIRGKPKPTAASAVDGIIVAELYPPIPGARWAASDSGHLRLVIPAGAEPLAFTLSIANLEKAQQVWPLWEQLLSIHSTTDEASLDLAAMCRGGSPRWPGRLTTEIAVGADDGPFATDVLTRPAVNPWFCRVRPSGFDFLPDGRRAAVATWDGDVWMVGGLDRPRGPLTWQRIASGMFQPLGVKYVDGQIYVSCRDQITILHDLNGDGETDFYESFNNDHQVTEHFHEFAMGLQTDEQGNFYYAKSARHALPALVPHHGTLLRVSKDGSRTDIVAQGFRAANGVCINPDGTFIVTDQEGHWNPKNRINWVVPGEDRFYGNMFGYHDVTDSSDEAMDQPLCWITNAFDRSPAELLWVDSEKWGPLDGSLLNTSYGYGMVYVVPHEKIDGQMQGGMCRLPIKNFPTGVMRGRFHGVDGQLYLCGMFSWAGSATQPGGFYRLRYTGKPSGLPVGLNAMEQGMRITFTDRLDRQSAENPDNYAVKIWGLKRAATYGSNHYNEHSLDVTAATLSPDGQSVLLSIPDIETTWCMEIRYRVRSVDGETFDNVIHNTVHNLGP